MCGFLYFSWDSHTHTSHTHCAVVAFTWPCFSSSSFTWMKIVESFGQMMVFFFLETLETLSSKRTPEIRKQLVYPTNPIIFLRNKTPIIFALGIWENLAFWGPILPCTVPHECFFFKSDSVRYLRHTKIICDWNISPEILVLFVCVFCDGCISPTDFFGTFVSLF